MVKIAIIDDGVVHSFPKCLFLVAKNGQVQQEKLSSSTLSHATYCARIITQNISDYELISISIFNENEHGEDAHLISALKWCINQQFGVINISCGYLGFFQNEEINALCYELHSHGTKVFSAYCNIDAYSCPAALPYVYGVVESKWKSSSGFLGQADINLECEITLNDQYGTEVISSCNSFACAKAVNLYVKDTSLTLLKPYIKTKIGLYQLSFLYNKVTWNGFEHVNRNRKDITLIVPSNEIAAFSVSKALTRYSSIFCIIFLTPRIPDWLDIQCRENSIRYWDESIMDIYPSSDTDASEISAPIILCAKYGAMKAAASLTRIFKENQYNVLLCSETDYDLTSDFWITRSSSQVISLYHETNPDIIIVSADSDKFIDADIYIEWNRNNCKYNFSLDQNVQMTCMSISDLYNKICSILND